MASQVQDPTYHYVSEDRIVADPLGARWAPPRVILESQVTLLRRSIP